MFFLVFRITQSYLFYAVQIDKTVYLKASCYLIPILCAYELFKPKDIKHCLYVSLTTVYDTFINVAYP